MKPLFSIRTPEELDTAAQTLSQVWHESFPPAPRFDGKKKNALRDMVLRLAGFPNGYQQWKANLKPALPAPEWSMQVRAFPDTLLVWLDPYDPTNGLLLGTPTTEDDPQISTLLYQLANPDFSDGDQWDKTSPLSSVPLWQALYHQYLVTEVRIEMPDIGAYGIPEFATDSGARALAESLDLHVATYLDVIPRDLGDDGAARAFITLSRRT